MGTEQLISSINRIGATKLIKWTLEESVRGFSPSTRASILSGAIAAAKAANEWDEDADVVIPQVAADAARRVKELHAEVDDARLYALYHLLLATAVAGAAEAAALAALKGVA